jgi:2-Cys peroxiredoxin 5
MPAGKSMSAPTSTRPEGSRARAAGWTRSAPRLELKSGASIKTSKQEFACELCDLSERGARLKAGRAVPDRFDLVLGDGGLPRLAQVRWTRGDEIGVQFVQRTSGARIPDVYLASPEGRSVNLRTLVSNRRSILVGVVGAFAPEHLQIHLAEVLSRADDLERSGYVRLICAAPNDPWTVGAWAEIIDPQRRLTFLSDGNLDLARWFGATFVTARKRHLGTRSRSYLALLRDGAIDNLTVDSIDPSLVFNERRGFAEHATEPDGI